MPERRSSIPVRGALICVLGACAPGGGDAPDAGGAAAAVPAYEVALAEGAPARFVVEAALPDVPTRLVMSPRGADHLADGWATFVGPVRGTTGDGGRLDVARDGPRGWRVAGGEAGGPVRIAYEVRLAHDTVAWPGGIDGAALSLPWGAFASGRALFVVPEGYDGPVRVRFATGDGRVAVAPWPAAPGADAGTLEAPNPTTLTESYVFVGDFETFTVERGGFELSFALGGPSVVARAADVRALAGRAFDDFIDLMGGGPRPAPDEPTTRIVVGIDEAEVTDGEVIGSHINILLSADPDPLSRVWSTFGFVHELFHLWNGKSVRSAGPDDWFTEGLTNYYALKALHEAGELSTDAYFGFLENLLYARYVSDDGYGRLSLRGAMEDKHGHWGLVYGGGAFAGICLDAAIRDASADTASLDDVMRDLFARYGGTHDEFALADVAAAIRRHGGYDPAPFFERHVLGAEPIPVADCLRSFGLEAAARNGRLEVERPTDPHPSGRIGGLLGLSAATAR